MGAITRYAIGSISVSVSVPSCTAALAASLICAAAGCTITEVDDKPQPTELCAQPLTNVVPAAEWVRSISPIRAYRYQAQSGSEQSTVALLADGDALLGTLVVRQVYDDPSYPDGAMRGSLQRAEESEVSVTTIGEMVDATRYRVRARLDRDGTAFDVSATFAGRACYAAEGSQSPPCAGGLSLGQGAYTLPSCGLLLDDLLRMDRAPTLERLEYAVPKPGFDLPALSNARFSGDYQVLPVVDIQGVESPEVVTQWAQDRGIDTLLGSESEQLLSTAFLDRTWWRELERHASHCAGEENGASFSTQSLRPQSCSGGNSPQLAPVGLVQQAVCDGSAAQPSTSDWADDGGSEETGGFSGDPHFNSLDGTTFDFQATGEFLLLESLAEPKLIVQARLEPMKTSSNIPACSNVSVGTAVAVLAGDQRIAAYALPDFRVTFDGSDLAVGQTATLAGGGVLSVTRGELTMEWPNGQRIAFTAGATSRLGIALPSARAGLVRGLLGQFDGDGINDFLARDGRLMPVPPSFEDLYGDFGDSWRIHDDESLFDYGPGESSATFTTYGFPSAPVSLSDLPDDAVQAALEACKALEVTDPTVLSGCVLDVVCAGESAAEMAVRAPTTLVSLPPLMPGLMVRGDLAFRRVPSELDMTPWPGEPPAGTCALPEAHPVFVHEERASVELANPVEVDIPGKSGAPTTLDAGAKVTSYLLHRRPGGRQAPERATLYFARPIVGVIRSDARLSATDANLGHPTTSYPLGSRAMEAADEQAIEAGGRVLTVSFVGDDVDQLRILTEAP